MSETPVTLQSVPSEATDQVRIPVLQQVSLLRECEQRGLTLYMDASSGARRLRLKGPGDKVTAELKERIGAAREALVSDLDRREGFVLQLEMWVDTATTWFELEMPLAIMVDAQHHGALTGDQVYELSRRAAVKARSIPVSVTEAPAKHRTSDRFMLTTQKCLAQHLGVPTEQLTSIFRPPPGEVEIPLEMPSASSATGQ